MACLASVVRGAYQSRVGRRCSANCLGARGVWHVSRDSRGAPADLASSKRRLVNAQPPCRPSPPPPGATTSVTRLRHRPLLAAALCLVPTDRRAASAAAGRSELSERGRPPPESRPWGSAAGVHSLNISGHVSRVNRLGCERRQRAAGASLAATRACARSRGGGDRRGAGLGLRPAVIPLLPFCRAMLRARRR